MHAIRVGIALCLIGLAPGCIDTSSTTGGNGGADQGVASSCTDGVQNGAETDVDCGGACSPCADGKGCLRARDCASGSCNNNLCAASGSCTDGMKSGTETDVDCGGGCPKCADGKGCAHGEDCQGGTCINNQ